jgi:hypothetical protein
LPITSAKRGHICGAFHREVQETWDFGLIFVEFLIIFFVVKDETMQIIILKYKKMTNFAKRVVTLFWAKCTNC